ncbi:MAG TPA: ATP-binding protein [Bacillota bacterium]
MRSIQAKIVVIFFLLILVVMQFIGTYLLRALESYYLADEQSKRTVEAQLLAADVASILAAASASGDAAEAPPEGAVDDLADPVQQLLDEFNQGRYVHMMVLDREGTVIAASDPALIGQRALEETEALAVLEEARVRTYQRQDPDTDTRRLGAAAPVMGAEGRALGVVLVEGDLSVVQQTLLAIREVLFKATLLAIGVAVLLAWVTSRSITGPIQAITARAAEMAAGDFDRRIDVRSRDELGRLAAMFNHLAGRLKDTLDEISTEKRKVETILTHMADGVAAFDREGRFILVNPAARRMLGLDAQPESAYLGRTLDELWPEWEIGDTLRAVLAGERPAADEAVVFRRGERTLRTYFAPIEAGKGEASATNAAASAGAVWVLHDVTELEQLEAMRREFVANVSHELRTPLTTIKSYSETLLGGDGIDAATRQRFLQVIHDETDRMARLVRDLLDLSQLESRSASWDREYCRLSELASQVLAKLQAQIQAKGLEASLDCDGDRPEPLVYVDPDRLQQVLVNIVSNSIEFTPAGGRVCIRVAAAESEVRVEVADTGIGIPPRDLPRIFERFYRVDKARTRKLGGTGLGLSIARQIVEGHGGRIGIESELGRGTTVWFTIPCEPIELAEAPLGTEDDAVPPAPGVQA